MTERKHKTRNNFWDEIKGLLIFFVVMVHVLEPNGHNYCFENSLYEWFQVFNMPLFIFIQGYFASHIQKDDIRLIKRFLFFIVLFIICKFVYYGSYYILHGKFQPWLLDGFWNEGSDPWFGLASAFFTVSIFFVRKFSGKIIIPLSIAVAIFAGFDVSFDTHFSLMRIINFFPFFLFGFYSNHESVEQTLTSYGKKNYIFGISLTVLIFIFWGIFLIFKQNPEIILQCKQLFWASSNYQQIAGAKLSDKLIVCFARLLWFVICSIGGISLLCTLKFLNSISKIFRFIGKKTLAVYFLHQPFIYTVNYFIPLQNWSFETKYKKIILLIIYILIAISACCIFSIPVFQKFLLFIKSLIEKFVDRILKKHEENNSYVL